jgi:hypothetical protein
MSEASITKAIMKRLKKEPNSWWFKVHGGPSQKAGIPDIIGCWRGLFIAIEVKAPGGTLRRLQAYRIGQIMKAGGVASMVYSVGEVELLLDTLDQVED